MARPDALPDDTGPMGTAAFTYQRWREPTDRVRSGVVVDRDDVRGRSCYSQTMRFQLGR